ncbi:MAG: hypothetical protein JWN93_3713 [Hyphomicrobiales bacterium]|nr:hypothetical protein [Hyphomicrobiales bacterium]
MMYVVRNASRHRKSAIAVCPTRLMVRGRGRGFRKGIVIASLIAAIQAFAERRLRPI